MAELLGIHVRLA